MEGTVVDVRSGGPHDLTFEFFRQLATSEVTVSHVSHTVRPAAAVSDGPGSRDALERLFDRCGERACRIAHAVCPDERRAQDAVVDAFSSVGQSCSDNHSESISAELLSRVYSCAMELERDAGNPEAVDGISITGSGAARAAAPTAAEELLADLRRLPGAEREVITLAVFGRLSASEIAAQFGLSSRTVKRWMRRGLQSLRERADLAAG